MTTLNSTTHQGCTVVDLDLDDPRLGGGVVIGYDGSSPSVEALAWAVDEAAARGTHLTVLHAADIGGELLGEAWVAVRDAAREKLATVVDELSRGRGAEVAALDVRAALSLDGPAETLVAASADADLVVVGNRGRGRVSSALLGSVAFSVTAGAACPAVVVRGQVGRRAGPDHPVVLGVYGGHDPGPAVAFAAATAVRHGADLVVVVACEGPETLTWGDEAFFAEDLLALAGATAARSVDAAVAAARTTAPGLLVRSRIVGAGAADALVQASDEAGLVVVGGHGHGRVAGLVLRPTGHRVIHEATCPVAVVRHEDRPPDEGPTRGPR